MYLCLAQQQFESAMDLQRFRRFLAMTSEEDAEHMASNGQSPTTQDDADALLIRLAARLGLDPQHSECCAVVLPLMRSDAIAHRSYAVTLPLMGSGVSAHAQ